jgi:hypothetical protein
VDGFYGRVPVRPPSKQKLRFRGITQFKSKRGHSTPDLLRLKRFHHQFLIGKPKLFINLGEICGLDRLYHGS